MGIEKVKAYFDQFGLRERIIELDESSATVELAAKALHTEGARIAKTLSFMVDGKAILIVTAGDTKIDNAAFRHRFGCKAKMLTAEELDSLVGHAPGGVCPFAVPDTVAVYLDESLKRFETVFPAAGSSNSAIEFTIPDLEKYSKAKEWVAVSKLKE